MDSTKQVAAAAVQKNLGPDPSMGQKVDLLRKLVAMRKENGKRGPRAVGQPVPRPLPDMPSRARRPGGGVPTRLPRRDQMPAQFAGQPGYNFGPPRGY